MINTDNYSVEEYEHIDELTGLHNLNGALSHLQGHGKHAAGSSSVIIYLNVMNFKSFNQRYGFVGGNEFLRGLAEEIKCLFPDELIARTAGDQFIILAKSLEENEIIDRLARLGEASARHDKGLRLHIKAGIYQATGDETDPVVMVDRAKSACDDIIKVYDRDYNFYDEALNKKNELRQYVIDNFENAYPIFKKHQVPFAVFVATDFPDKKAVLWWYVLEELILNSTEIELSDGSKYTCKTFQEKWDTFRYIREKVLLLNQSNLVIELNKLFANYELDWLAPIHALAMNWEQVKVLTQEPLCTIGGHTVTHVALNKLSVDNLDSEIMNGIDIIKSHTGYEPEYFAYPYGSEKENGEREYDYVRNSDIKLAFISYGDLVYSDSNLELVPRFMLK